MFKKLLLLSTALTLFAEGAGGSEPNSLYLQASYVPVITEGYFADDGEVISEQPKYKKHGLSIYAKYGLWDESLSLIGNFGFRTQKIEGLGEKSGLEDMSLKLDWRFLKGDFPLAISYEIGIPLSSPNNKDELALGDGEIDHSFRIYNSVNGFDIELGYHLRTQGFSDAVMYGIQYKHNPMSKLYLSYGFRGKTLIKSADQTKTTRYLEYGEGIQYHSPYIGAFYSLSDHFHSILNLGFAFPGLPQSNLAAFPYVGLGLAYTI